MGKPQSKRTHKRNVEQQQSRLSPEAIRANKCERTKARRAAVSRELQAEAQARTDAWRSLSYEEQLKRLDYRLGKGVGATKQRARIAEAIKARDEAKAEKEKVQKNRKNRKRKGRKQTA